MNNEIIKAMNSSKSEKKHSVRKWWNKNGYKVMRVVLFPLYFWEKLNERLDKREVWSDARAKEIFDYYVPRASDWDANDKTFYFFDNGYGWSMCYAKKHLKLKDRRFWNVHRGFFGGKLRNYLINEYELDGFKKEVNSCYDSTTDIQFTMIEK